MKITEAARVTSVWKYRKKVIKRKAKDAFHNFFKEGL
jgi:hypothetical protein